MRIATLQRRLRERGRIRIGYSTPGKREGLKRPHKLDRFRFTATDRPTIDAVAALYGGEVKPWAENGRDQWDVITEAREVRVVFATGVSFSQSYEAWAGGFLTRLCDGERSLVPGRGSRMVEDACTCDPDERTCRLTTHLGLILPDLPGLGTWRLVTHGYYAATELAGAVDLIESALGAGLARVPARLLVERREVRRLIDGEPEVRKFAVPVLELDGSVAALGAGGVAGALGPAPASAPATDAAPALGAGGGWSPVQVEALPEAPMVSVADQLAEVERDRPRRKGAAPPLPATGVTPVPSADADTGACGRCGEPYGTEALARNPQPGGSRWVHARCLQTSPQSPPDAPQAPVEAPGGTGSPVRPSTPVGARPMTHGQHRKVMALAAEAFPSPAGATGAEVDEARKAAVLGIAGVLGQPGLTSRSEITHATATPLIDALEAISAGRLRWTGEALERLDDGDGEGDEGEEADR